MNEWTNKQRNEHGKGCPPYGIEHFPDRAPFVTKSRHFVSYKLRNQSRVTNIQTNEGTDGGKVALIELLLQLKREIMPGLMAISLHWRTHFARTKSEMNGYVL